MSRGMRLFRSILPVFFLLTTAAAQVQPPPPAPPPQGGRGGGRGRGGVQVMTLTTAAWQDGGSIPPKYAQPGGDVSPALAWSNVPETTASFVLVFHDLDAPIGSGLDDVLHWLVWNIPGSMRALPEGIPQGTKLTDGSRQISQTGPDYRGPAAPASGPAHHYVFELYALDVSAIDTAIDWAAVGRSPAQTRAAIVAAMAGHIRGKGVYTGLFKRPQGD
jgi:Raf kinase inhibitor-like YbhB/YbcL family protein